MYRSLSVVIALLLCGCAHSLGYAGKNPGAFECYGKGVITFQGSAAMAVGYGGTELNAGSISGDCGPGFGVKQWNPENPIPAPSPAPK